MVNLDPDAVPNTQRLQPAAQPSTPLVSEIPRNVGVGEQNLGKGLRQFAAGQEARAVKMQAAAERLNNRRDSINRSRADAQLRNETSNIMRAATEGGTDFADPEQAQLIVQEINDATQRADALGGVGSDESVAMYEAKKATTVNSALDQISVLQAKAGKDHQNNAFNSNLNENAEDLSRDPGNLNDSITRLQSDIAFQGLTENEAAAKFQVGADTLIETSFDGFLRSGTPDGLAAAEAVLADPNNPLSASKRTDLNRRAIAQRRSFNRAPNKLEMFEIIHGRKPLDNEKPFLSGTAGAQGKTLHTAFFPDGRRGTILKDTAGNFFDLNQNPITLEAGTNVLNTTNLTGGQTDLGLGSTEKAALTAADIATANTIDATKRLRIQLKDSDTVTALSGKALTFLDTSVDQLVQFGETFLGPDAKGAEIDGEIVTDPRKLLDESLYNLDVLGPKAAKSAAFRGNVMNLAYIMARAAEPQGRLSNEDIKRQITRIGANAGRGQLAASLDEVDRNALVSFANTHASFRGRDKSIPPIQDRFTDRLAALGGKFGDAPIPGDKDGDKGAGKPPEGVTQDQWDNMTDEGRALFKKDTKKDEDGG